MCNITRKKEITKQQQLTKQKEIDNYYFPVSSYSVYKIMISYLSMYIYYFAFILHGMKVRGISWSLPIDFNIVFKSDFLYEIWKE